jgi:RNA polymerase sigma-70 factor (ECF subfamily)
MMERDVTPPVSSAPVDMDLVNAISGLPPKQRAATVLFYYEDMPLAEVAEMLGCSHATARVHVQRARTRLASMLGEEVRGDVG